MLLKYFYLEKIHSAVQQIMTLQINVARLRDMMMMMVMVMVVVVAFPK
jgi:hypothetical protein